MTDRDNTSRCPRCHSFIIAEQVVSHKCSIPITDTKTIWFDWISDGFTDKNDDYVRNAKGLDGTLYGLIVCKHNPPHSVEKRWLGGTRGLVLTIFLLSLAVSQSASFVHAVADSSPNGLPHPHAPNANDALP